MNCVFVVFVLMINWLGGFDFYLDIGLIRNE